MRTLAATTALAFLAGLYAPAARAEGLGVGDAAPKLEVKEFVKGEPIAALEPGNVYVIEFWATWCAPCRVTIPELTELQKKHPEVKVVGVSIWEDDAKDVRPFVEKMGGKMDYRVAVDAVPEKGSPDDGAMSQNWAKGFDMAGIPNAFIVNKDLKVAWIGHPSELAEPLGKVVDGSWSLEAAVVEAKKAKELDAKMAEHEEELQEAIQSEDHRRLIAIIDAVLKKVPAAEKRLSTLKFMALVHAGEEDKALELGRALVAGPLGAKPHGLNRLASTVVDPEARSKPGPALVAFALEAARKGDELAKGQDPALAETLARAYFDSGDFARAVEAQERVLKLAEGSELAGDDSLKERLEEYRKAAGGKKD